MLGRFIEAVYVAAGFSPSPLSFDFALCGLFIHSHHPKQKALDIPRASRSACLFSILYFLYVLYFLNLTSSVCAMHRVQRPPKRIQRLVRRSQNIFLITVSVLF
jgi:hypothetical protein